MGFQLSTSFVAHIPMPGCLYINILLKKRLYITVDGVSTFNCRRGSYTFVCLDIFLVKCPYNGSIRKGIYRLLYMNFVRLPNSFRNTWILNRDLEGYRLRNEKDFNLPRFNLR